MKLLKQTGKIALAFLILAGALASCNSTSKTKPVEKVPGLKKVFESKFHMGTALNSNHIFGKDTNGIKLIKEQFNSIVAENCMKSMYLQPEQGKFYFDEADKFVEFGEQNNMFIIGHTLVWHSQAPQWLFVDNNGDNISRDTLIARMKNHIQTVVGRYKGRVHGWDVVNEAIDDTEGLRKSKFLEIIGPEYIELAFQFAHEADPKAELYYNDYSLNREVKRNEAVKIAQNLIEKGIRIDGIGMQAHYGLMYDVFDEVEASIKAYTDLGINVMITELDVTVLHNPSKKLTADISTNYELKAEYNPYENGLPDSVQNELAEYYGKLFKIYKQYSDKITRITFWGVTDGDSWKNNWPIKGRTNYPLVFDRNYRPKPAFYAIIEANSKEH